MRQVAIDPIPAKVKQEELLAPGSVSVPVTLRKIFFLLLNNMIHYQMTIRYDYL